MFKKKVLKTNFNLVNKIYLVTKLNNLKWLIFHLMFWNKWKKKNHFRMKTFQIQFLD